MNEDEKVFCDICGEEIQEDYAYRFYLKENARHWLICPDCMEEMRIDLC